MYLQKNKHLVVKFISIIASLKFDFEAGHSSIISDFFLTVVSCWSGIISNCLLFRKWWSQYFRDICNAQVFIVSCRKVTIIKAHLTTLVLTHKYCRMFWRTHTLFVKSRAHSPWCHVVVHLSWREGTVEGPTVIDVKHRCGDPAKIGNLRVSK